MEKVASISKAHKKQFIDYAHVNGREKTDGLKILKKGIAHLQNFPSWKVGPKPLAHVSLSSSLFFNQNLSFSTHKSSCHQEFFGCFPILLSCAILETCSSPKPNNFCSLSILLNRT